MRKALALMPDHPGAQYLLAIAQRELGNFAEALDLLEKSVALEPGNAQAQYTLGRALAESGRLEDAISAWKAAAAIDPNLKEAFYSLSQALMERSPAEAQIYRRRFVELQEQENLRQRLRTMDEMTDQSIRSEEWLQAAQQMARSVEVCGNCSSAGTRRKKLGWIQLRSRQWMKAIEQLQLAQQLNPDDRDIPQWIEVAQSKLSAVSAK